MTDAPPPAMALLRPPSTGSAALWPCLGAALCVSLLVGVCVGAVPLTPTVVLGAVRDRLTGSATPGLTDEIVWGLRLPRALLAAVVGAGLALAGAVLRSSPAPPRWSPGGCTAPGVCLSGTLTSVAGAAEIADLLATD